MLTAVLLGLGAGFVAGPLMRFPLFALALIIATLASAVGYGATISAGDAVLRVIALVVAAQVAYFVANLVVVLLRPQAHLRGKRAPARQPAASHEVC